MSQTRRLAAILAADVAGYSRLIEADEAGTLQTFKTIREEVFDPKIAAHHGRLVKTTGDGFLAEFSSVVDALHCATEVQARMAEWNATVSTDKRIDFRIGINVGDIVARQISRTSQGRPSWQRVVVVAQFVYQIALYRLMCRSNIDPKNPRGVLAEDLVLHLRCQLRVTVLPGDLLGYREDLESFDLPMRRPDHRSIGTP